jgi:methylated-DNA-protein-cysteine methyltransferase-like protein
MSQFDLVREIVKKIPQGKVSTYGNVAQALGLASPRIVGWALRGNQNSQIPCHRVVQKSGTLAPNFSLGGWQGQKQRLEADGVSFVKDNQIDMENSFYDLTA